MAENEKLYLRTWEYNAACILTELAKIVVDNGGRTNPSNPIVISNRNIANAIFEYKERIERLREIERINPNEEIINKIEDYIENLRKLEEIDNAAKTVTHKNYIKFVLDDFYYHYCVDGNPLFDFYYTKTQVKDGQYSQDAMFKQDKKEWLSDNLIYRTCYQFDMESDIKTAADSIFNMLVSAEPSKIYREGKVITVPDTYGDSYHREMIHLLERFRKIDF